MIYSIVNIQNIITEIGYFLPNKKKIKIYCGRTSISHNFIDWLFSRKYSTFISCYPSLFEQLLKYKQEVGLKSTRNGKCMSKMDQVCVWEELLYSTSNNWLEWNTYHKLVFFAVFLGDQLLVLVCFERIWNDHRNFKSREVMKF